MRFINCTPHQIYLNNGDSFPVSGKVARVSADYSPFDGNMICSQVFGKIVDLPDAQQGVYCIVSAMVLAANMESGNPRMDLVAPATGHPDCIRNDKGHILSVPGFVQ
jgi:hypothetical protein